MSKQDQESLEGQVPFTANADICRHILWNKACTLTMEPLNECRKELSHTQKNLALEDANTGMRNFLNIKSRSEEVSNFIEQCHRMTAMGQQRHQGNRAA